ncbi:hypothetical protein T10_10199 [Trichinella papuae]|uniref:Uncharacterized protein n=1 Tax=Trichinella papuae TaxID=268474 RepID=A0A0V1MFH9_9BILA|nr:hypothetical protein T10_10199 [Trichinella papuae]
MAVFMRKSPRISRFSLFLCFDKIAFTWLRPASTRYELGNATSRSALISTCSSCNENSMFTFSVSMSNGVIIQSGTVMFSRSSKRLLNITDGSYTFSTPHVMSGPHQQENPQSSDTNQQVFVSNPLLTTILLPCEKAVG